MNNVKLAFVKIESGYYKALFHLKGYERVVEVFRFEPGTWGFCVGFVPSDTTYNSVHEAKKAAQAWFNANIDFSEERLPTVVVDWHLGERNVRFLANTSARTTKEARVQPKARILKEGTKHLYVVGVQYPNEDRFEITVEANNRTQAAAICKKLGLTVCDMYMEG